MCRCLQVFRSSFYHWFAKADGASRLAEKERLKAIIIELFHASRGTYGTRRLKRQLQELGESVSRRLVNG